MNSIKSKDLEFGFSNENKYFELIKKTFDINLERTTKNYIFDYESDKTLVELKSRRCDSNTYPTTMVGENKIKYAEKSTKDVYFVFAFNDGVYYWKYDKNVELKIDVGGRMDRGRLELNKYAYIKKELLKKIS
jgi:hypothetical protein